MNNKVIASLRRTREFNLFDLVGRGQLEVKVTSYYSICLFCNKPSFFRLSLIQTRAWITQVLQINQFNNFTLKVNVIQISISVKPKYEDNLATTEKL
jgi:hypothetical protein